MRKQYREGGCACAHLAAGQFGGLRTAAHTRTWSRLWKANRRILNFLQYNRNGRRQCRTKTVVARVGGGWGVPNPRGNMEGSMQEAARGLL